MPEITPPPWWRATHCQKKLASPSSFASIVFICCARALALRAFRSLPALGGAAARPAFGGAAARPALGAAAQLTPVDRAAAAEGRARCTRGPTIVPPCGSNASSPSTCGRMLEIGVSAANSARRTVRVVSG